MEIRAELHQAIDQLDETQVKTVIALVQDLLEGKTDLVLERLKKIPGIRLSAQWPPQFERVQPVKLEGEGELASEQLIRERR
jgi:hypothetical protein